MRNPMMALCIAVVALGAAQMCSAAELRDVLTGKVYPLSVKAGDLDRSWVRLTPVGDTTLGWTQMYAALLGGQAAVYYTRGDTVQAEGEIYLVAYGRQIDQRTLAEMMRRGAEPMLLEPITAETRLTLSLLNLRSARSLTNIQPFHLSEETAQQKAWLESQQQARSLGNLKNLAVALQMWLADHEDMVPDLSSMEAVGTTLDEYVKNRTVFTHPVTGQPYGVNSSLSGLRVLEVRDISNTAVFYEQTTWSDGTRGVAFLDGHAARVSPERWQQIKRISGIR